MNRLLLYAGLSMLAATAASANTYSFVSIDYISTSSPENCGGLCIFNATFGWSAVNDSNEVATSATNSSIYFGYTYLNGVYSAPISDGTFGTTLAGIADSGELSGSFVNSSSLLHGMTDTGGSFSTISFACSVSPCTNGYPDPDTPPTAGQTLTNGIQENVGGTPIAVGFFLNAGVSYGYVDDAGTYSPLECVTPSGGTTSNPYSINDSGIVAGYCKVNSGSLQQGFIYNYNTPNVAPTVFSNATLTTALYGSSGDTVTATFLTSIDDSGDLAGYYTDSATGSKQGFYCTGAYTLTNCSIVDFAQTAAYNQGATVTGTEITGINNIGSITGEYTESDGTTHVFLATVASTAAPEPGTLLLTALSIAGLAVFLRRRKAVRQ